MQLVRRTSKEESPPASPQEAYRLQRSESSCAWLGEGRGGRELPLEGPRGTPLPIPPPPFPKKGPGTRNQRYPLPSPWPTTPPWWTDKHYLPIVLSTRAVRIKSRYRNVYFYLLIEKNSGR